MLLQELHKLITLPSHLNNSSPKGWHAMVLSLIPSQAIILSMAGSGCERLFINSVDDIQTGVTQNKLNDEIWV